jgi:putative ABC transport system permease protein
MDLLETFQTAFDSLFSNKLRALLTMLGIIIGVAAVIALMSIGNGFSLFVSDQIQAIGTNVIYVMGNSDAAGGYPALSMSDVEALSDPLNTPAVVNVAATVQVTQEVVYGSSSMRLTVLGVTPNYFEVNNLADLTYGSLLARMDDDTRARVVVLGASAAADLFGETYPVGEQVKINGVAYEVIGVLAEKGGTGFANPDENVYIPLATAQARLYTQRTRAGQPAVTAIMVQARNEDTADQAAEQVAGTLRIQHNIAYTADDDFRVISQTDLLDISSSITQTLTLFLGAIAGISLLVGGIGIMNIMLVSVTERTREIGIRKAIGALRRDILAQFLIESLLLSVIGGVIGIVLGWLGAAGLGRVIDLAAVVDFTTVLLATGFSAAVGLIFGIYPAWRAASLRPIEALRYE